MKSLRIVPRLLLGFLLLSPLPLGGLAWLYLRAFEASLVETVQANLVSIADKKANQIAAYVGERTNDSRQLARSSITLEIVGRLRGQHPPDLNAPVALAYRREVLNLFEGMGYYDLLLTDAEGDVIFSLLHEPDFGANLNTGPYRDSALARAQREALSRLDTLVTPAAPYAPSGERLAIFIVTPVVQDGAPLGTVALQLDLERLTQVTGDATGLGRSGETVPAQLEQGASGPEVLHVGPLQRVGNAAFRYRVPLPQVAPPMRAALDGKPGEGRTWDYSGTEVLAAWRTLPALRWGMVVKQDLEEALAPAARLRNFAIAALGLLLFASALVAILFGGTLAGPIIQLTAATRRLAAGEPAVRAAAAGCQEFRELAASFNQMADRIHEDQVLLERRVAERTRDLEEAKTRYDELTDRIPVGVYCLRVRADGGMAFEYVSPPFCRALGIEADALLTDASLAFRSVHPEDQDAFVALSREVARTLTPFRWEGRFVVNGATRWFRIESAPTPQPGGDSLWNGVMIDITARKQSQYEYQAILNTTMDGFWVNDLEGRFLDVNDAYCAIVGYSREELLGMSIPDIEAEERPEETAAHLRNILAIGADRFETRHRRRDGTLINVEVSANFLAVGAGRMVVFLRDITERKRADAELRLAAHVFEHSGEAIVITDRDNRILSVNAAFTRLTGYTGEEARGRDPKFLSAGRTGQEIYRQMWEALGEVGFWMGELWDRRKDGAIYPKLLTVSAVRNPKGEVENYIGSFTDISEQKAAEERIRHVAHHDALTGLPNRLHLTIGLEQDLAAARRKGEEVAVMFIDLDRFKIINDTLGHPVGDGLLVEVARRLRGCVRESDLLARLGGDEFVIAIGGRRGARSAVRVAEKVLAALAEPCLIGTHRLRTSPSIGISLFPADGEDIESLMKHADTAMYHAKSNGRNNFHFFSAEMNQAAADRLHLENRLHIALTAGEFVLHYQPQVDRSNGVRKCGGRMIGVEALVRWQHPEEGLIGPDRFIPIAEESGFIIPLGEWVLETACAQLHRWLQEGRNLRMAINISQHQLRSPRLLERVSELVERYGLAHRGLELEITESVAMQERERTIETLHRLRALGVELAIDDFGTGYSSLSYLKLLPIQRLKLDRSFVKDIETDPNDAAICSATIALAHALGLEVVAEGVETAAQRDFLHQLDCDLMQGYLFSRPATVEGLRGCLSDDPR